MKTQYIVIRCRDCSMVFDGRNVFAGAAHDDDCPHKGDEIDGLDGWESREDHYLVDGVEVDQEAWEKAE